LKEEESSVKDQFQIIFNIKIIIRDIFKRYILVIDCESGIIAAK